MLQNVQKNTHQHTLNTDPAQLTTSVLKLTSSPANPMSPGPWPRQIDPSVNPVGLIPQRRTNAELRTNGLCHHAGHHRIGRGLVVHERFAANQPAQ